MTNNHHNTTHPYPIPLTYIFVVEDVDEPPPDILEDLFQNKQVCYASNFP